MPFRNNVTRLLDAHKIQYEVFEFSPEKHSAEEVAELLGVPPECVYKTLVVLREGKGGSRARPLGRRQAPSLRTGFYPGRWHPAGD